MIKFQYISDTHLEHYKNLPKNIIEKIDGCENICLLGDIGFPGTNIYNEFIDYCSKTWKNVFLLYGNHEYYQKLNKSNKIHHTMNDVDNIATKLPKNVYFLNNSCVYINKLTNDVSERIDSVVEKDKYIKIIGSTLWSDINLNIAFLLNDYKFIYTHGKELLKPYETKLFFHASKKYILNELKENIQCILLTHHGVHPLTNGYYQDNYLASGYASNIVELSICNNLIACINGHTHSSIDTLIPNTSIKLLSNCYGYKGENKNILKYNKNAILEID